jgi:hypothetical protein
MDHGGAGSLTGVEYRGKSLEMRDVPAYGLDSICSYLDGVIDLGHWDVQGAELRIAQAFKDFLDRRV